MTEINGILTELAKICGQNANKNIYYSSFHIKYMIISDPALRGATYPSPQSSAANRSETLFIQVKWLFVILERKE